MDLFCFTSTSGGGKARAPQDLCAIDTARMHAAAYTPDYMSVWVTCAICDDAGVVCVCESVGVCECGCEGVCVCVFDGVRVWV